MIKKHCRAPASSLPALALLGSRAGLSAIGAELDSPLTRTWRETPIAGSVTRRSLPANPLASWRQYSVVPHISVDCALLLRVASRDARQQFCDLSVATLGGVLIAHRGSRGRMPQARHEFGETGTGGRRQHRT